MKELLEQARSLNGELVRWRRHIHENPEVGADLPDTCAYVTEELRKSARARCTPAAMTPTPPCCWVPPGC